MITPIQIREAHKKRSDELIDAIQREHLFQRNAPRHLSERTKEMNSEITQYRAELTRERSHHSAALKARDVVIAQIHTYQMELAERTKMFLRLKHKKKELFKRETKEVAHLEEHRNSTEGFKQEKKRNDLNTVKLQDKVDEGQQQLFVEAASHKRGMDLADHELQRWLHEAERIETEIARSMQVTENGFEHKQRESNFHHQNAVYEGLMNMLKNSDRTIETSSTELTMRIVRQTEVLQHHENQIMTELIDCSSSDRLVQLQEAKERIFFVRTSMPNLDSGTKEDNADSSRMNTEADILVKEDVLFTPQHLVMSASGGEESWHHWLKNRQEKVDTFMQRVDDDSSSCSSPSIHSQSKFPKSPTRSSTLSKLLPPPTLSMSSASSLLEEINQALTPRRELSRQMARKEATQRTELLSPEEVAHHGISFQKVVSLSPPVETAQPAPISMIDIGDNNQTGIQRHILQDNKRLEDDEEAAVAQKEKEKEKEKDGDEEDNDPQNRNRNNNSVFKNLSFNMAAKVKLVMQERALIAKVDAAIQENSDDEKLFNSAEDCRDRQSERLSNMS